MMTCLAVCIGHLHMHAGEFKLGTLRLKRKLASPIFSVRICVAIELSAYAKLL